MTVPRRIFLKKSAELITTGLLLSQLPILANENPTELPSENETNTYHGSPYGIVDYYRWPSDLRFTQMLDQLTNIDVVLYSNPQFVSIDDDCLFAHSYLFATGHIGF